MTVNPASRYGLIAEQEFDAAAEHAKPELTHWLNALSDLSDDEFYNQAMSAIHDAAMSANWRGNWNADECKGTAAYKEAKERHARAGHSEGCTGDTIYSRAFAAVWRSQGHDADAYPPRACDCGAVPAEVEVTR